MWFKKKVKFDTIIKFVPLKSEGTYDNKDLLFFTSVDKAIRVIEDSLNTIGDSCTVKSIKQPTSDNSHYCLILINTDDNKKIGTLHSLSFKI